MKLVLRHPDGTETIIPSENFSGTDDLASGEFAIRYADRYYVYEDCDGETVLYKSAELLVIDAKPRGRSDNEIYGREIG